MRVERPTMGTCVALLQLMGNERAPAAFSQAGFRQVVEAEIERLIAFVDAIDGDADLEDGADYEPYLAHVPGCQNFREDDREGDGDDDREPDNDSEYSLGWRDEGSQLNFGLTSDLEDDNDSGIADFEALSFERQDEKDRKRFKRLTNDERNEVQEVASLALRMRYRGRRQDADTLRIISPGVAVFAGVPVSSVRVF